MHLNDKHLDYLIRRAYKSNKMHRNKEKEITTVML